MSDTSGGVVRMKAVPRVALTFFNYLPLQTLANLVGSALIGASLIVRMAATGPSEAALALAIIGGCMVVIGPVFGGGAMLRQLSALPAMSLRPGARVKLLLGATLAMNVVVLLITLPFLLDPQGTSAPPVMDVFAIAWGTMALNWVGVFAASAHRYGLALVWIIPVVGANLLRFVPRQELPDPLIALLGGLLLWGAFSAWYLSHRRHQPLVLGVLGPAMTEAPDVPPQFLASAARPRPLPQARRQWLFGDTSLLSASLVGAGAAVLMVVLLAGLVDQPMGREKSLTGNLLYIGVLIGWFFSGYGLVGRSRMLWLRAGLNRAGLLRHAETHGLLPALVSFLSAALVIVSAQAWMRPDLLAGILLNAAAQMTLGLCLAYWGLALTRHWSAGLAAEMFAVFMLGMVGNIVLGATRSPGFLLRCLLVLAVFAMLLRFLAHRRWRHLDWRVKRPQMNAGMGMRART